MTVIDPSILSVETPSSPWDPLNPYKPILVIDTNKEVFDQTVYLCSPNTTVVQPLLVVLWHRCVKPEFVYPIGDSLHIKLFVNELAIIYPIEDLLKTSYDIKEGPCRLFWELCADPLCLSGSPVRSDLLSLTDESLIANPVEVIKLTSLYLAARYNGTNTRVSIQFEVNEHPFEFRPPQKKLKLEN